MPLSACCGRKRREEEDEEMSQESLVYSFVARGTTVLAEYTSDCDSVSSEASFLLPLKSSLTSNSLVEDGYAYCVVAKESVGKQVSVAFLERMKEDFKKRYRGGKADNATAKSLNKEFSPAMKEHMQYIMDRAEATGKLLKVKAEVSEVKSIMLENIDQAIATREKLDFLDWETEDLLSQDLEFKKEGTQVWRKMLFQNMKIKLLVLGILLLLLMIIWVSVCQGFNCTV